MPEPTRLHLEPLEDLRRATLRSARARAESLTLLSEDACCVQEATAFATELRALFLRDPLADRAELAFRALHVVRHVALHEVLEGAVLLARSRHADEAPPDHGDPVTRIGRCTWAFVRAGSAQHTLRP